MDGTEALERAPIGEALSDLLGRLDSDANDALMGCLAADVNQLFFQVQSLTGRDHINGADARMLILRWRMTVALADGKVVRRPPRGEIARSDNGRREPPQQEHPRDLDPADLEAMRRGPAT